ncbi:MAG: SLC13 family permease [Planctomycetes bacterium]|nr:SLC13 family permease [Planctomycetota bacterium]
MRPEQAIAGALLVGALVLQAARPQRRLLVVTIGAGLSALTTALAGLGTAADLLSDVPWDVLVILAALGLLTQVFVASRLFGVLAAAAARRSGADPRRLLALFAGVMFVVSGLANNLTALLLVLPVLLTLLKLLGVDRRYLAWTLGVLLVACNLGGAASPIGDFPAILLLGRGSMRFDAYLAAALPPTAAALLVIVGLTLWVVRPARGLPDDPVARRVSVAVMDALHREVRLDRRLFAWPAAALAVMLLAWVVAPRESGLTPELIAWLGVGAALVAVPALGERLIRTRVDVEAALFLLALFVMVGAVRRTGVFQDVAAGLAALPMPPVAQLVVFLLMAGLLTGVFSAGPSMAALLDVAESLATRLPPHAVYVGLALSVCAGSSLFLTAATAGPMAQAITERAGLRDPDGAPLRFGFSEFLPVGLVSFAVIQATAIAWALVAVARG